MTMARSLAVAAIGLAGVGGLGLSGAQAQDKIRWKMQSAFGSQLPHLGPPGQKFQKDLDLMSGGKFEMRFYEPGALIPALECFDAVGKGSVEACWTTPGFHASKFPAMAFFTTVPFGPELRRVPGLEVVRRRQQIPRRNL